MDSTELAHVWSKCELLQCRWNINSDRTVISFTYSYEQNFLFFAVLRMPIEIYTNVITTVNCQEHLHPYGVFFTTTLSICMSVQMLTTKDQINNFK
jgi:hypothetical protein